MTQFASARLFVEISPWWKDLFHCWNRFSSLLTPCWAPLPDLQSCHLTQQGLLTRWPFSKGTGLWVLGLQHRCPSVFSQTKSFFPIVILATLWGTGGHQNALSFLVTTMPLLRFCGLAPRDPNPLILLCHLSLLAALYSFSCTASSAASVWNSVADALSCFQFQKLCHLAPQASAWATPIPGSLL